MKIIPTIFLASAVCLTTAFAQDTAFTVKLTTPLSTSTSHKGDAVAAQVVSPDAFKGDSVQGHVTEVKKGNKIRGTSVLNFNFDTLQHAGTAVPIASSITSIANSKGQENVDEEGRVIRKGSNVGKAGIGTGLGAAIGGIAGGWKGAAIGAGVGAAASVVLIEVAAEGPREDFAVGAQFGLSVKSRGGPELASLTPNTSTAPPAAQTTTVLTASNAPIPAAALAPAASTGGQPNFTTVKIDFIPGERTIFYDDFSDMAADEPPPHWKVRQNPVELRTAGSIRELFAKDTVEMTSPSFAVPQNFTFQLGWTGKGEMDWSFRDKGDNEVLSAMVRGEPDGQTVNIVVSVPSGGELGHGTFAADTSQPVEFALWAQQGRVRAYVNGQRLVDANQVKFNPIDHLYAQIARYRENGIRSVRVAESAPDFSATIAATGKYISHGINFDTNSDHLKPESGAVLKEVSGGLQKNPNLKLEIDGYTDSVGDANHNLDLSKRRAEAVRTVLVSQFGVDASRLTSNGFGPAKPIGSNDTADGRAQNRRVEFVKQ